MYDEKILCSNIKYLRKKNKLTQKRMAEIIGVSISSVKRMEKNLRLPRIHVGMLYRICVYFDVSADMILSVLLKKD